MFNILRNWFNKTFSHPEAVLLVVLLVVGFSLIILMGNILAPVLAAIILAYLLESPVEKLQKLKIRRFPAVCIVFTAFISIFLVCVLLIFPLFWQQFANLLNDLPNLMSKAQRTLILLPERYPDYFSAEQIQNFVNSLMVDVRNLGKVVLSASISSIPGIIAWLVYVILVPLLVFFFLKDRTYLLNWASSYLPKKRGVLVQISTEVNAQIGNYLRGKFVEIIAVTIATYAVFIYFHLEYGLLLASMVGIAVLIPYVGAVVATIPVVVVGYLQFGFSSEYGYMLLMYLIVQALDTNILVPLLFSEAVNLHPIAIIVAILFFGGIWGFWGIFFAIPLATLIKAVINAWPSSPPESHHAHAHAHHS